ncbi:hypothetical protein GPECTOR_170g190 [Gonium pectorale]|uniref:Uncharacterized protein n=1 Tax=Gonium pectorale TaxID=33097 RepID=A0A150FYJ4_GONPE|nr:hypothetical protein GPECTOR_170g190 [Gonium pectorale]|eukprot:KXZ42275.1 hypothetical protein GPECTOR_170g190 [Gonium pectorale]
MYRMHIIGFKAPTPVRLARAFPCHPSELPELITVILVGAIQTFQDVQRLAERTPALFVRARVIAQWARHLAHVYRDLPGCKLDEEALREWERRPDYAIPPELLTSALHTHTEGEADALLRLIRNDQEGYAHTRYGTPEQAAAAAATHPPPAPTGAISSASPPTVPTPTSAPIPTATIIAPSGTPPPPSPFTAAPIAAPPPTAAPIAPPIPPLRPTSAATGVGPSEAAPPAKPAPEARIPPRSLLVADIALSPGHPAATTAAAAVSTTAAATTTAAPSVAAPSAAAPSATAAAAAPAHFTTTAIPATAPSATAIPTIPAAAPSATAIPAATATAPSAAVPSAAANPAATTAAPAPAHPRIPTGPMYGADDMDLATLTNAPPHLTTIFRDAIKDPLAFIDMCNGRPLVISTDAKPENDYNPSWMLYAHPNRFPNGTGACPVGMTFHNWVVLQLRRWTPPMPDKSPDESAEAPHFILDAFDIWQRHTVNSQAAVRLRLQPDIVRQLGAMDLHSLTQTVELLAAGLPGHELAERLVHAPPAVAHLVRAVRATSAQVIGSPASYGSLRSRCYGLWVPFGPPSLSFTLNPSAVNAEEAFRLAGYPYEFDPSTGDPIGRPDAPSRWHIIASHPRSSAEFFLAFIRAFCDVFLGWPEGSPRQTNPNCIFGRIDAYVFKFEMNHRGELHAHGCIWQRGLRPRRLSVLVQDPSMRNYIFDFMEGVQSQCFPSPTAFSTSSGANPHDAIYPLTLETPELLEKLEALHQARANTARVDALRSRAAQAALLHVKRRAASQPPLPATRVPLKYDTPDDPERLALYASEAILTLLIHLHKDGTCTAPHIAATDTNCRMRMPRCFPSPTAFSTSSGANPHDAIYPLTLETPELLEKLEALHQARANTARVDALRSRAAQAALLHVKRRAASQPPLPATRVPLKYDTPDDPERLALYASEAILTLLIHLHKDGTCTAPHIAATDTNCRMRMPRVLNLLTTISELQTHCVHLRRYGRWLVAHMVALLLALPCNHTLAFTSDISRWVRTVELWEQKHAALKGSNPELYDRLRPRLPSVEEMAADAADYALKYATKAEPMQGSAAIFAAATVLAVQRRRAGTLPAGQPADLLAGLEARHVAGAVTDDTLAAAMDVDAAATGQLTAPQATAPPTRGGGPGSPSRADLEAEGKFNLARAINAQTAVNTFSSPAAALLLLLGRVALESHEMQPIDYRLYAEYVGQLHAATLEHPPPPPPAEPVQLAPQQPPSAAAAATAALLAVNDSASEAEEASDEEDDAAPPAAPAAHLPDPLPSTVHLVNRMRDYLHRGTALQQYSPIVMTMFFYKRTRTAASTTTPALQLDPAHPQFATHAWSRRQIPYIPQPLSDPPVRPADTSTDPFLRDRYAAFALGTFAAYSATAPLDLSGGLWAAYRRYFFDGPDAGALHVRLARHMLDNVDLLARVRMRADQRRQLQADVERSAEEQAEAALMEGTIPAEDLAAAQDDEHDMPYDAPRATPPTSLWTDQPADDATIARISGLYTPGAHAPPPSPAPALSKDARYVQTALSALPPHPTPPHPDTAQPGAALAPAAVLPPSTFTPQQLALLQSEMHEYNPYYQPQLLPPAAGAPTLQLLLRNSADVHAQLLVYDELGGIAERTNFPRPDRPGEPPPYILLPLDQLPSPDDTAHLFTLSDDQRQPFLLYAQLLLHEKAGQPAPPLQAILTGKPGTGKSQVLLALLWFAFQHRCHHMIAVVSYMWRAALHDTTPGNQGQSTTTFFATSATSHSQPRGRLDRLQCNLNGIRLILLDEFSTCSLEHLSHICSNVYDARTHMVPHLLLGTTPLGLFCDLHALFVGDPRQLEQPQHAPIYHGAAREDQLRTYMNAIYAAARTNDRARAAAAITAAAAATTAPSPLPADPIDTTPPPPPSTDPPDIQPAARPTTVLEAALLSLLHPQGTAQERGRLLWRSIPYAFVLTRQHRAVPSTTPTAPGLDLYQAAELFNGIDGASHDDIVQLCDLYNSRAPSEPGTITDPYLVLLRHSVRVPALYRLVPLHAAAAGVQLLIWRSTDFSPDGTPLPPEYLRYLETIGGPMADFGLPATGTFFTGIRYYFTTNSHPNAHHLHNNTATGLALLPHPDEPPIPPPSVAPIHILRYVPRAIIVRPDGAPLGRISRLPQLPDDAIAVLPTSKEFTPRTGGSNNQRVARWGFPLEPAYAVTDYFAEGDTFRGHNWLAHLCPPPTGGMHRATLYVVPTRFTSLDSFRLLCPLWPPGDTQEQRRVLDKFTDLARPIPDLQAEWHRLQRLAAHTAEQLPQLMRTYGAPAPPPIISRDALVHAVCNDRAALLTAQNAHWYLTARHLHSAFPTTSLDALERILHDNAAALLPIFQATSPPDSQAGAGPSTPAL